MDNMDKQLGKTPPAKNVFDGPLGGQDFGVIRTLMPEHDEMQRLAAQALEKKCAEDKESEKLSVIEIGTGTGFTTSQILNVDPRITLTSILI